MDCIGLGHNRNQLLTYLLSHFITQLLMLTDDYDDDKVHHHTDQQHYRQLVARYFNKNALDTGHMCQCKLYLSLICAPRRMAFRYRQNRKQGTDRSTDSRDGPIYHPL